MQILGARCAVERPFGPALVIKRGGKEPVEAGDELVSLEGAVAPDLVRNDQAAPLHPRKPGIEGLAGLTGIGQLVLVEVLHPRCSGQLDHAAERSEVEHVGRHDHIDGWARGRRRGPEPTTPSRRASASANVGPRDRGSRCRDGSVPPTPRPTHDGIRRETARPAESSPSAVASSRASRSGRSEATRPTCSRPASCMEPDCGRRWHNGIDPWASKGGDRLVKHNAHRYRPWRGRAAVATTRPARRGRPRSSSVPCGRRQRRSRLRKPRGGMARWGRCRCGRRAGRTHRQAGSPQLAQRDRESHRGTRLCSASPSRTSGRLTPTPWPHRRHGRGRVRDPRVRQPHDQGRRPLRHFTPRPGANTQPPDRIVARRRVRIAICT